MENKVIAFTEVGKVEVMDASMPKVGPKDVLVHIKATCLCTQEQRVYRGIKTPIGWPVVGGHESAGIVVAVGDEVNICNAKHSSIDLYPHLPESFVVESL